MTSSLWKNSLNIPRNDEPVLFVKISDGKAKIECGRYSVFNDRFYGSCGCERSETVEWCYVIDILKRVKNFDKAFNTIQKSVNIFETTDNHNDVYACLKSVIKELKL